MIVRPDNLVTVTDAATACGVNVKTVREWLRAGAPQARRGRRGRGGSALLDVQAIKAWRASRDGTGGAAAALEALAADVPAIVAGAVWRTWQLVGDDALLTGHARRTAVGALMVAWTEITTALRDRIAIDAPDVTEIAVEPVEIGRLAGHLRSNR